MFPTRTVVLAYIFALLSAGTVLPDETPARQEHLGQSRMRQDNASYASMVAAVDDSVGRLYQFLADRGELDATRTVLMAVGQDLARIGRIDQT